jgi:3-methyladenine DNA glycosylase AlkC
MAEPFKNLLNPALVQATGEHLQRVWKGFQRPAFEAQVLPGFEALEMKARAMRIADALEAQLPDDFDRACGIVEAALAPADEGDGEGVATLPTSREGLAGWIVWPLGEFVARRGLAQPDRALQALQALTQRFSAEFAIRPLIAEHPALSFKTLAGWTTHRNTHVRRLVSEGSRPRLPWGLQLKALIADPSPTLPLLEALQDDPTAYVRKSVANHLNDIAKDHPHVVVGWVQRHRAGATAQREALLSHASRSLIKQGHAPMLALWGAAGHLEGEAVLTLSPKRLRIGESLQLSVKLVSRSRKAQTVVIDLLLKSPSANSGWNEKVFKGWNVELAAQDQTQLTRALPLRAVTTRRVEPGPHRLALRVNGQDQPDVSFTLLPAA